MSCKAPLSIGTASYMQVKSGQQGQESYSEFILVFNKPKNSLVEVNQAVIYGFEGFDYYYDSIVLNDELMKKTLNNSTDLTIFSVYLNTSKAYKKMKSKVQKLRVEINYSSNKKSKSLKVTDFANAGVKSLRKN
jgi:hypothetical protein